MNKMLFFFQLGVLSVCSTINIKTLVFLYQYFAVWHFLEGL